MSNAERAKNEAQDGRLTAAEDQLAELAPLPQRVSDLEAADPDFGPRLKELEFVAGETSISKVVVNTPNGAVWRARCPSDSSVVSGLCRVDEAGDQNPRLQNMGAEETREAWSCVWGPMPPKATAIAYCRHSSTLASLRSETGEGQNK